MPIERIKRLKNYRIFRDFEWPATLPNFARYNLVYGWNGAGKTSLSNIFRLCQIKSTPDGEVELSIDGQTVSGTEFSSHTFPNIRVFNRDFVDRNVFEDPSHELPPVFVLGEDSQSKQLELDKLLAEQTALADGLSMFSASEKESTIALSKFCTDQARSIRNLLSRDSRYTTYEAPRFKEALKSLSVMELRPALLTLEERQRLESTSNSFNLEKVIVPKFPSLDLVDLSSRVKTVIAKDVIGKSLKPLVENFQIAGWVQQGLILHKGARNCYFCESALDSVRIEALQDHFNNELRELQDEIEELTSHVEDAIKSLHYWNPPQKGLLYQHLQNEYSGYVTEVIDHLALMLEYLERLCKGLTAKKAAPFKPLDAEKVCVSSSPVLGHKCASSDNVSLNAQLEAALKDAASVEKIRVIIKKHNNLTENFALEQRASRVALEKDEVLRAFDEWEKLQEAVSVLAQSQKEIREKLDNYAQPITELKRSILHHMKPAEELSRDMTAYLGRSELTFEVRDTGYLIRRGGEPAMHLSDGERTAIAFMYFLKSLTDTSFDRKNGVVVIDDPVSSLDANSLYSAFAFMKERTVGAGQLIVLTHNFAFFSQVKNWFKHLGRHKENRGEKGVSFYMLGSRFVGLERHAHIQRLDPLLHEHESEYHYLFQQVRTASLLPAPENLETVYGMPNIARRLLESFAAFRAPHARGLENQIQSMDGTVASKVRIVRFLHTHSHADHIAEAEHDLTLLSETPAVLLELLAFVKLNDARHYDAMVSLTEPEVAVQHVL